jgi:ABC-type dipeptide/oligopeptide/nickel transport system ATPase component
MRGDIAATSALDMSVQAQIVDLLRDLQKRRGLAYLFISHDLKVVRALASEIIVMRDGKVVESGRALELLAKPRSAYTRALFAAAFDIKARFWANSKNPRAVLDAAGRGLCPCVLGLTVMPTAAQLSITASLSTLRSP